jgi:hypothetical protein
MDGVLQTCKRGQRRGSPVSAKPWHCSAVLHQPTEKQVGATLHVGPEVTSMRYCIWMYKDCVAGAFPVIPLLAGQALAAIESRKGKPLNPTGEPGVLKMYCYSTLVV